MPQLEITAPAPLLDAQGRLNAAEPLLDCNLEAVRFYPAPLRFLQRLRVKRWDYYGVTTPDRFFSVTLADLGYAGQAFVYTVGLRHRPVSRRDADNPARPRHPPAAQQHRGREPLR